VSFSPEAVFFLPDAAFISKFLVKIFAAYCAEKHRKGEKYDGLIKKQPHAAYICLPHFEHDMLF
jgi:hypothetical protein